MEKMSFKTFVFPNNPHTYEEQCSREAKYEKNDAGEDVFQGLGPLRRTVSGEGRFFGELAFENFRALAKLMEEKGKEMQLSIRLQREDIFEAMHRV